MHIDTHTSTTKKLLADRLGGDFVKIDGIEVNTAIFMDSRPARPFDNMPLKNLPLIKRLPKYVIHFPPPKKKQKNKQTNKKQDEL